MRREVVASGLVAASILASCSPERDANYQEAADQASEVDASATDDHIVTQEPVTSDPLSVVVDRLSYDSLMAFRQDLIEGDALVVPINGCLAWPESSGGITIVDDPVQFTFESSDGIISFMPFLLPDQNSPNGVIVMNGPSTVFLPDGRAMQQGGVEDISANQPVIYAETMVESVSPSGFSVAGHDGVFGSTTILTTEQARSVLSVPAGCSFDELQDLVNAIDPLA